MSLVLTISGVEQGYQQGTLTIRESIHSRGMASLIVQSRDGTYRPVKDEELIVSLNSVRLFGGVINDTGESGTGAEPIISIDNAIDCVDFNVYGDWRNVINGGFLAGTTLETALNAILGYLTDYGVTIDAGQVTGPDLPLLVYDVRTIASILAEITQITGYITEIDYNKVLRGYLPGTTAAPFDILDSNNFAIGDLSVEPATTDRATDIIGRFGTGAREVIDNFTGDGGTSTFQLNYFPLIAHRGIVNVGGTVVNGEIFGGTMETLSINATPTLATWDYNPATGYVTRSSPVPNGTQVYFQYTSQFPVTITATTGVTPVREVVVLYPEIFDRAAAAQALNADLSRLSSTARRVRYQTHTTGLRPGMSQTIQSSKRNFNSVCYIEELTTTHLEGENFLYDVVAIEGTLIQNWWGDIYKEWSEMGGGGFSTNVGGGVVLPPIPGPTPTGESPDIFVVKNSDETVNASAVLQNDNELFFPVEANSRYWLEMVLFTSAANTTSNFKVGWSAPTACVMYWGAIAGTTNYWGTTGAGAGANLGLLGVTDTHSFGSTGTAGRYAVTYRAMIQTAAAGTLQMQWSQNTSNPSNNNIHAGSFIRYKKIAQATTGRGPAQAPLAFTGRTPVLVIAP